MNDVSIGDLPWLDTLAASLRDAFERGRLGHGILLAAAPGLGAEHFARWLAALVLCESSAGRPCGACPSCHLFASGTHPDFTQVRRLEDATQVKVEQVRELSEKLGFKSYRGGYKAAIVPEADAMNANAANALLKTLEEPPPSTLLVLCSARPSRLPATIVSRCQRFNIAAPDRAPALAWLNSRRQLDRWPRILAHAAGAPLRALELEASGFPELDRDMQAAVERLAKRTLDIQATADRWHRNELGLRLAWLDEWIAGEVRTALAAPARLPRRGEIRNIRELYALLDRVRAFRLELDSPLNKQLATEELLMRAETALQPAARM